MRREVWGLVPYEEALQRQIELHRRRCLGLVEDTLVVVEHPPTVTLGRNAPPEDVLWDAERLAAARIVVARADRGGRATYHGPGQAVLYPIVGISDLGLGAKQWVKLLEDAVVATLAGYGVPGQRKCGSPGIWTVSAQGQGPAKIASIGLRIVRGVSYHGVAVNVSLDVSAFDCIVTCGVASERVTSIHSETGKRPDLVEVSSRLAAQTAESIETYRRKRGA